MWKIYYKSHYEIHKLFILIGRTTSPFSEGSSYSKRATNRVRVHRHRFGKHVHLGTSVLSFLQLEASINDPS